jgi:DNA-directed RNA polymerase subunit alpha
MQLEELELPLRPLNVLHDVVIATLADLVRRSEAELLALRNFGRKDAVLLRKKLAALGLVFGMVPGRGRRRMGSPGRVRKKASS